MFRECGNKSGIGQFEITEIETRCYRATNKRIIRIIGDYSSKPIPTRNSKLWMFTAQNVIANAHFRMHSFRRKQLERNGSTLVKMPQFILAHAVICAVIAFCQEKIDGR